MSWERCSRHCLGPSAADSDGSRSRSRSPECPFERLRLAESRDRGYGRAGRAGEWTYLTEISRWYRVRSADGVYSEFVSDRLTPLVNIHYITTYLYSKCVLCCILCTPCPSGCLLPRYVRCTMQSRRGPNAMYPRWPQE